MLFPPFASFIHWFIGEMSDIRNDPGLIYEMPKPTSHTQRNVNRNRTVSVTTRKTNTAFENPKDTTQGCLLHRGAKHTINECTAFQTRSLENRKTLLRNHNLCLRCCETSDHFAKKCHSKIYCDICRSYLHCTALHPPDECQGSRGLQSPNLPVQKHDEEETRSSTQMAVGTHCTQICGGPGFTGRSCARIVPVCICPEGHPEKSVLAYSMLDDQSNKTLGRSLLFNRLGIDSTPI